MSKAGIEIRSEAPRYRISIPQLRLKTAKILKVLKIKSAELNLLLTTDPKIRRINKKHLKHDFATDVISFPHSSSGKLIGDLVISLDTTKRQAKEYGNSFDYELAFYICHGILHLLGYEDYNSKDAARMERLQTQTLKKIGMIRG